MKIHDYVRKGNIKAVSRLINQKDVYIDCVIPFLYKDAPNLARVGGLSFSSPSLIQNWYK
ncbi:hypothetical protein Riv7116_6563 [Rivularia sp. PCC 7116]|nr:hypothetical protein Riv7116_6563 [Rivularia sp. PCC 7116]